MPAFSQLSAEELRQLIAYIRSLSATAARPNETVAGNASAGETLFFGKAGCATCHQVNARGGIVGPDLSNAGRLQASVLRQKIVDPNRSDTAGGRGGALNPSTVIATTKGGQAIQGIRRSEDSFGLLMVDALGKLQSLDKRDLASVRTEQKSLMPSDYRQRLSDAEIQDLVSYLKAQNGRDLSKTVQVEIPGGLSFERIRNSQADPQNWLTYWGDYHGHHFSALKEINTTNARQLQARWAVQMQGDSVLESTPLVIDGIMYVSGQPGQVYALDAKTGLTIWKYQRTPKVVRPNQTNRFNRGVAVLGNRVFVGTLDAALVALDARNGQPLWETFIGDTLAGYAITSAPLALKDKIIIGTGGGEYGVRGFVDAYDPATGKRLWRFNTIPGPGDFGFETWKGETWKSGAGATWLTGSYDAETDTLFWTVGNPGPDIDANVRQGDNLYSCSVVALDPATGQRKWHYQFTPGDSHDWDATEDVMLVDRMWHGQPRKLMLQANRNGLFYVLDRTNGKFLSGKPFVKQTWNVGFDENGRPKFAPGSESTPEGAVVYPGLGGGTNWQSPSYSPDTGWFYVETQESGQKYVRSPVEYEQGKLYMGGAANGIGETGIASIKALDPETGETKWEYKITRGSLSAGVLATAGNVVFAATAEGTLVALNSRTGAPLWRFQAGGAITASPMSYAVDGKQFVAVTAAGVLYSFALPE
jgi:alcohol dehydrogenase (cytochrome c)